VELKGDLIMITMKNKDMAVKNLILKALTKKEAFKTLRRLVYKSGVHDWYLSTDLHIDLSVQDDTPCFIALRNDNMGTYLITPNLLGIYKSDSYYTRLKLLIEVVKIDDLYYINVYDKRYLKRLTGTY
jgi:hypothetical protein